MTANEDDLIPGIYNYCDRWCERCEFSARCDVFRREQDRGLAAEDMTGDDLVAELEANFAEAEEMLLQAAEEFDIDVEAVDDREWEEIRSRTDAFIDGQEAVILAKRYGFETNDLVKDTAGWLDRGSVGEDMAEEMVAIIGWYMFAVAAKLHRAFHGVLDTKGYEDPEANNDTQSDSNGSAKIALILIERSMLAWSYLLDDANAALIRPRIALLERIKALTEEKFPSARDFIRPGFDEIEAVM